MPSDHHQNPGAPWRKYIRGDRNSLLWGDPRTEPRRCCAWNDTCASSYKVLPAEGDALDGGDGKHDILGGCTQGSWGTGYALPCIRQRVLPVDTLGAAPPGRPITGWHCVPRCQGPDRAPRQNGGSISDSGPGTAYPKVQTVGAIVRHGLTPINWSLKHWTRPLLLPHSGSEARALGDRRKGNLRARRTAPKHSGYAKKRTYTLLPKCCG